MPQITLFTNSPASREAGCLHSRWKKIRFFLNKRVFLRRIESILNAAAGHEGNSLPSGNYQYQVLAARADELCEQFARRWGLDVDLLRAQMPGLAKLAGLSLPPLMKNYSRLACLGVVAIPLALFLIGALAGLLSLGFHLVGGR
jgi:hypothetical protein